VASVFHFQIRFITMNNNSIILFSYSGHAYVVADILIQSGQTILGYLEKEPTTNNPFKLKHLGFETDEAVKKLLKTHPAFIANGDNKMRQRIFETMNDQCELINAIHPSAIIATHVEIGNGTMLAANVVVNAVATIGNGVILNTGCIIEHECVINDYAHIAPGAVLCGNVTIGSGTFVGANAVIKQGISIGKNCVIGAGAVILKNVPDATTVVGNNGRILQ
jgi:sugar O-acyltransferase (sialic acid O-acetyltransferase NeuD family)